MPLLENTYELIIQCLSGERAKPLQYKPFLGVQSPSHVWLSVTPWTAAHQASLFFTITRSLLKLKSTESVMPSNISFSVSPFSSCPQSFPASGSFPMSQLFTSAGQSIGVSASVLPMNTQDWSPLGWTGWTHCKHYPQWWKIESIFPKVRNKTMVPTLTTSIQHSSGSFSHSNQRRKRNKRNPNWKRRSKTLSLQKIFST